MCLTFIAAIHACGYSGLNMLSCFLRVDTVEASVTNGNALSRKDGAGRDQNKSIYFLGMDTEGAPAAAERLQRVFSPGDNSRWALTEHVRELAKLHSGQIMNLSASIDNWNPEEDPYNFGAAILLSIDTTSLSSPTNETSTWVVIDLLWIHIGHDIRTRFARQKMPEIRFTASKSHMVEFSSKTIPAQAQLDRYLQLAFDEAVVQLLKKASSEYNRQVNRSIADVRYVSIAKPSLSETTLKTIEQHLQFDDSNKLPERIQVWLSSFIEDELMKRFQNDSRYDSVVLLPNPDVLEFVRSEWPVFAARVSAQSSYSANLADIGFDTPRLLKVAPLCETGGEGKSIEGVPGLEVRSSLAGLRLQQQPQSGNKYISVLSVDAVLAAAVKLPLTGEKSIQTTSVDPPILTGRFSYNEQVPVMLHKEDWLGWVWLPPVLANVVNNIADSVTERLLVSIQDTPHLSHPSLKRYCQ
ncbi:MAG: hypothetical protein PVG39_03695 [Desulfobacteraceae bacterium]|jgi:hypothetical protein